MGLIDRDIRKDRGYPSCPESASQGTIKQSYAMLTPYNAPKINMDRKIQ